MIEFAKSMSGHDRNQIYLICEQDGRYVYLVNGTTKPLAAPKKKSVKHIQIIKSLPVEVEELLGGVITDISIKRAIKQYVRITNNN
ncbi:MAG: KOW domain-containing protein [Roseburia sp.]